MSCLSILSIYLVLLPPPFEYKVSQASIYCSLIRDFERDAKADNMPIEELNYRKKQLVQELNSFIGLKKAYGAQLSARGELIGTVAPRGPTQEELDSTLLFKYIFLLAFFLPPITS